MFLFFVKNIFNEHYTRSVEKKIICTTGFKPGIIDRGSRFSLHNRVIPYIGRTVKKGGFTVINPLYTRDRPRCLSLRENDKICNERVLIEESVCWSEIQRGLSGPL